MNFQGMIRGALFLVAGVSTQTACSSDDSTPGSGNGGSGGSSASAGSGGTGGSGATGAAGSGGVSGGSGGATGGGGAAGSGGATGGASGSGNGGTGGGSCAPVLFSSDWSGGLLDGGKWTSWGGTPVLTVVSASGLGFPSAMSNVLRVQMGTGSFDWVEADAKWSLPAVGDSRAYRIYFRNDVGAIDGGWSATHPLESKGTDGAINGDYYALHVGSDVGATFPFAFATAAPFPRNIYTIDPTSADVGRLNKGTTYRLEWKWTRTGASDYSLDMRITGPDDATVLYDASTIEAWGGSTLASDNTGFPLDDWAVTGMRVGLNGGFSATGTQYVYWGGFAVCTDWCGGC